MASKRVVFGAIYGLILVICTLAGIEFLSSFYTPAWPARVLRSVPPANPITAKAGAFEDQPWTALAYNSWGMRDVERPAVKPPGGPPRITFVGDSFVESAATKLSLPAAVEKQIGPARPIEAINLGVAGTDPKSYYYRVKDVAMKLSPDALVLVFCTGNDFVAPDDSYPPWPALVDESPGSSLVGSIMPRFNWLLVNRLRLSQFLRGQSPKPIDEIEMLYGLMQMPLAERMDRLVPYVHKAYHPELSEARIREILSRGDNRLTRTAEDKSGDHEYFAGWILDSVVNAETTNYDIARNREDAARLVGREIEATLSWLEAIAGLAREQNVPLLIFFAPVGTVDPAYADFWSPWPRYYAWNWLCDERLSRLVAALAKKNIRFVDLREDLKGVPGTYRKLDGHWTEKGEAIVANRMALELGQLLKR